MRISWRRSFKWVDGVCGSVEWEYFGQDKLTKKRPWQVAPWSFIGNYALGGPSSSGYFLLILSNVPSLTMSCKVALSFLMTAGSTARLQAR